MMNVITVAQIGVGYWGPNLLRNLIVNKNCRVKAIADLSNERRDYVKKLYPSVNVTENADDIFKDETINAIVISTPVHTHFNLVMKALNSGKHVLV